MSVSWTPQQQNVIKLRKRNILVSAAAGSGKTAVLVERIKARILDKEHPIDIDELLVVTFTKAAAAQMRDRIALAIERELEADPLNMRLQQQLTLIYNAQITTIDSFCLYVIRNHFHEIDLDPNFRIADEGELALVKQEVLTALLEEAYEKGCEDFLELADIYASGKNDEGLKNLILQLYEYAESYPWPEEWLLDCERMYQIGSIEDFLQSPLLSSLYQYVRHMAEGIEAEITRALAVCEQEDGPYMYVRALEDDLERIRALGACFNYDDMYRWMQAKEWMKLSSSRGFAGSAEKLEYIKNARNGWKHEIDSMAKKFFFTDSNSHAAQMMRLGHLVHTLVTFTISFANAFASRKREKNLVDFGDLEHFALEILVDRKTKRPTAAAQEFQKAYEEIMIDEYQDSNYVQEAILRAISRETRGEYNLFMVGDVKQSIYRFRLARPELFMEKFDSYTPEESKHQRIDLYKNFRSREEVLEVTNDLFHRIMRRSLGNVEYDEAAALYPGASYPQVQTEMFAPKILLADRGDEMFAELAQGDKVTLEARVVASAIGQMMREQLVTDEKTGELRSLRYGDIVILLRSLSGYGDEFAHVLMEAGIPAHTTSKNGYFSAPEVQTVLNFLRLLDNPFQDIPLAAVLKSPIGDFGDEDLARVRILDRDISFSEAFWSGCKENRFTKDTAKKAASFADMYDKLRREVADRPIHELLQSVFEVTGYDKLAAAMPGGRQRQANLEMLMERAIAYEGTSYRGLFHFIRYIDELQKYHVDYGEADLVGENEDAVRIMSIHKSKGLEFPVVFVSGLGKQFNRQDTRSRMILHPSLGIGLEEVDVKRHLKIPTLVRRLLANQGDLENLGEELRILYVALTRAKEKLILTGTADNLEQKIATERIAYKDAGEVGFVNMTGAKSYLDWILPALISYGEKYPIQLVTAEDLIWQEASRQVEQKQQTEELLEEQAASQMRDFVENRLSYVYPYQHAIDLQMKYSVSELKHRAMRELAREEETDAVLTFVDKPVVPYIPAFMDETEGRGEVNPGAVRGTAVHRVLECLDFAAVNDLSLREDVISQIRQMLEAGRITAQMAELVRPELIAEFLSSDVGKRMRAAAERGELYREKPFVLGLLEEEMILVQGIIDVFWMEGDTIALLDYKTDRVSSKKQLADLYRKQLELYAKALEAVWKKKVAQKYLYSFSLHETVELED